MAYDFDFTELDDGNLSSPWVSSTFSISDSTVINSPNFGDELLTDPGLEATYTDGKCDTLTKNGSPTLTEESVDVHGGDKAQKFLATAFNDRLNYPIVIGEVGGWYLYSIYTKRIDGDNRNTKSRLYQSGALPSVGPSWGIIGSSYTQLKMGLISTTTNNIFAYCLIENGSSDFNTVLVDDASLKQIIYADLFAMLPSTNRLSTVKIKPSILMDQTITGIIAWADDTESPSTFLLATIRKYDGPTNLASCSLIKCIEGTYSTLISETARTEISGMWLEIRPIDNETVALYYNNIQIGNNQKVTDVIGSCPGMIITGENNIDYFYCGITTPVKFGFAGSSNTLNNSTGYRPLAIANFIKTKPDYELSSINIAHSGWATWPNLINLSDLKGCGIVIFDQTGDDPSDAPHVEAFIRKLWGNNSNVISIIIPGFNSLENDQVNTPSNLEALNNHIFLCNYYEIQRIDFWQICKDNVPKIYNLTDLMADTAHPTALGFQLIEAELQSLLPNSGTPKPSIFPDRYYEDTIDFEQVPIKILGCDYDSRSGTWVDEGTQVSSVTEDSIIIYSGAFRMFGCYREDGGSNNVVISIDGDHYKEIVFYNNGYDIEHNGNHVIAIKIPSGGNVKIDKFWAIGSASDVTMIKREDTGYSIHPILDPTVDYLRDSFDIERIYTGFTNHPWTD